jgi:hypothetical protein
MARRQAHSLDYILRVDALRFAVDSCIGDGLICSYDHASDQRMGKEVRLGRVKYDRPGHYYITKKGRAFVAAQHEARHG